MDINPKYIKLAGGLKKKNREITDSLARIQKIYNELSEESLERIEAEAGIDIIKKATVNHGV